ncbi:MAG: hypothetical protein IJ234_02850, partial [Clostridia bacterium]|nr:hypothetical protein [Clostridia bacterium]
KGYTALTNGAIDVWNTTSDLADAASKSAMTIAANGIDQSVSAIGDARDRLQERFGASATAAPTAEPTEAPTATPAPTPSPTPVPTPTPAPINDSGALPVYLPETTADPSTALGILQGMMLRDRSVIPMDFASEPEPVEEPTEAPTAEPTATPTTVPTATPTVAPTATPTTAPTATPTPTAKPTATPTTTPQPSAAPTASATTADNALAATATTVKPTEDAQAADAPTEAPTDEPTDAPTTTPTATPTQAPTPTPTVQPTAAPTPTIAPTATPTVEPTQAPTAEPTATPVPTPTATPVMITLAPTPEITPEPTLDPSLIIKPVGDATVYYFDASRAYHYAPNCVNMTNAHPHTLSEAIADGKRPCGNCGTPDASVLELVDPVWTDEAARFHMSNECDAFQGKWNLNTIEGAIADGYKPCPVCRADEYIAALGISAEPTPSPTPAPSPSPSPTIAAALLPKSAAEATVYYYDVSVSYHYASSCKNMPDGTQPHTLAEAVRSGKHSCGSCNTPDASILDAENVVWADDSGHYHLSDDCAAFTGIWTLVSLDDALEDGLRPCAVCGASEYTLAAGRSWN